MKALAAVSIRQYQRAVESPAEFNRTVELGLQIVLRQSGEAPEQAGSRAAGLGAIVFGTDQGLRGQLNHLIADHAVEEMKKTGIGEKNWIIIAVGMRVADLLEDSGRKVFEILSPPGSTAGITSMVQDITVLLEDWRFKRQIGQMHLFYHEYLSGPPIGRSRSESCPLRRPGLGISNSGNGNPGRCRCSPWRGKTPFAP